jgi:O-antigen/teichoic acid export membrane protein
MKNKLFKKFLSFSYGSWIGLVIGFFGTMITTRILMPEDFGRASMFTLAINISMIFIIFGTDQTFVRFFYEEQEEKRGGLLYNCLKFSLVLSSITLVLILIFYRKITLFLFEEERLVISVLLGLGILTQVLHRFAVLVIRMQQKGNLFSVLEVLNKIINLVLILLVYLLIGRKYEVIVYSTVISFVILTSISIYFGKIFWNIRNFSITNLKHTKIEIMKFSYPLVMTTLITWLFQSFDKIALKQWSGFEELGLYAASFRIVALLMVVQTTFTTFWVPVCLENYQKDPNNKAFYEKISRVVSFAMFFIAVLSIAGKDVIIFFLGREYAAAANIMPFMVYMPMMYTISETTVIGINFYKKPKWHILIAGVSCLVNIVGNSLLVPNYGAIGAAISTAFAYVVFFAMRTQISLKYYKVNYGLKKIYFMILLVSSYAMYSIINNNFYINLFVGFFVMSAMLVLYWKDLRLGYKQFM